MSGNDSDYQWYVIELMDPLTAEEVIHFEVDGVDVFVFHVAVDTVQGEFCFQDYLVQARPAVIQCAGIDGEFSLARSPIEGEVFASVHLPFQIREGKPHPILGEVPISILNRYHGAVIDDLEWFLRTPIAEKLVELASKSDPRVADDAAFPHSLDIAYALLEERDLLLLDNEELEHLADSLIEILLPMLGR